MPVCPAVPHAVRPHPGSAPSVFLLRLFWTVLLLAGLSACGGSDDAVPPPPPPPPPPSLAVSIGGLPAGVNAALTLSGPAGYSRNVTQSLTFSDVVAGTYTLTASTVVNAGIALVPEPATQQIVVGASGNVTASVSYRALAPLALALQPVASGLQFPTYLTAPPGDSRLFIVERPGRVRIVDNGTLLATPFLDISARVRTVGEGGLLSIAFHPLYALNGRFFLYFTDAGGNIVIEERMVSAADRNAADAAFARPILSIAHPNATNHYGGQVQFGTDGYLYVGSGDGGGGGDPFGNGQNSATLLGKLLRIDINGQTPSRNYLIPAGNPFVGQPGRMEEIWATGLRNPWRYSFDTVDKLLYLSDVGQDLYEEVNVVRADQAGNNYGWNIMEAANCYNAPSCDRSGLTEPVLQYAHGVNNATGCSIAGGYVYRGLAMPELSGQYLYSDFCTGFLKSFKYSNGAAAEARDWGIPDVGNVISLGQDGRNELYILSQAGVAYRIVRQ